MTDQEVVLKFIDEVFNAHDLSKLDEFMREDYMQHSIGAKDGRTGFREFAEEFFKSEPYMDVKQVFESQNHIVAVFFKCSFNHGNPAKVVDMYRLEDGKLAEHWDVVQLLPEDDTATNGRGSF